jgi:hypothetical protein
MNQPGRLWRPVFIGASVLLLAAPQARAIVDGLSVGGGISIRQEDQEDRSDFRLTADLYATEEGREEPYWGYLTASKELLMAPNAGLAVFSMVLVTPDGKPITEARWSEDPSLGYADWHPMERVGGRWLLPYPLTGRPAGTRTLYFAGRIRRGKGSYMKLLFITVGGRKALRQADALQLMIYRLPSGIDPRDPEMLIEAQEAMGAGGKALMALGPRDRRAADDPVPPEPVEAVPVPPAPVLEEPRGGVSAPPGGCDPAPPVAVPSARPSSRVASIQVKPAPSVRPASATRKPAAPKAAKKPVKTAQKPGQTPLARPSAGRGG